MKENESKKERILDRLKGKIKWNIEKMKETTNNRKNE